MSWNISGLVLTNIPFQAFIGTALTETRLEADAAKLLTGDFESLDDFETIYSLNGLERPDGITRWRDDVQFGNQRLQGVNPRMIELCQEIPPR